MGTAPAPHLTGPEFLNRARQWEYWRAALAVVLLDVSAKERDKTPYLVTVDEQTLEGIRSSLYPHFGEEASLMAVEFALNAVANVQPPEADTHTHTYAVSLEDVWATATFYCAQTLHAAVRARGFVDGLLGASLALHAKITLASRQLSEHAMGWSKSVAGTIADALALASKQAALEADDHQQRLLLHEFKRRLHTLDAADIMKNSGIIAEQLGSTIDIATTLVDISKPHLSWFDSQIYESNKGNELSLEVFYGEVIRRLMATPSG